MSSSSEIVDSSRYSGQNTPFRAPEKSSFNQTCNLFSQYLKENSTFPDLTLGMRTATMSLFPMTRGTVQQQTVAAQNQQDESKRMTIFYNGQVMVFNDLTPDKVKEIMKLAEQGAAHKSSKPDESSNRTHVVAASDLPIARKASLARFLEKRKDRVTARSSPYQIPADVSKQGDNKDWLELGARSH